MTQQPMLPGTYWNGDRYVHPGDPAWSVVVYRQQTGDTTIDTCRCGKASDLVIVTMVHLREELGDPQCAVMGVCRACAQALGVAAKERFEGG